MVSRWFYGAVKPGFFLIAVTREDDKPVQVKFLPEFGVRASALSA
jgi:hypothetical protein